MNSTKNSEYWKEYNKRIRKQLEEQPIPEGFEEIEDALEWLFQLITRYKRYRNAFMETNKND
tara:strand:- start:95 stop:280 length:186 start_codon:yes stop_codon:yes gene_type:complete